MSRQRRVALPPPPVYNDDYKSYEWQEWFRLVHYRVNEANQFIAEQLEGTVSWQQIDTSGSELTDFGVRPHSDLQQLDYDQSGHTGFAREEGDDEINFSVAIAVNDEHAVRFEQLQALETDLQQQIDDLEQRVEDLENA